MMKEAYYNFVYFIILALALTAIVLTLSIKVQLNNKVVSGVVYNTTNDSFIAGNTTFSVRASEDTYVSKENKSSFCLSPNSPYRDLVNEAAIDKNKKVIVESKKIFKLAKPWTCIDNVTVKLIEE